MKVAFVTAPHRPGRGYVDTLWLELLPGLDHQVRLITSGAKAEPVTTVKGIREAYELQRVPTLSLPRNVYLSSRVKDAILDYDPDLVVWSVPDRYFGRCLLDAPELAKIPVITIFSANLGMHEFDWRKRGIGLAQRLHALGHRVLRGRMIRRSCQRSTLVIALTKQTPGILLLMAGEGLVRDEIAGKIMFTPLGYHPGVFGLDPIVRRRTRDELGFAANDVVICMSSRFAPGRKDTYVAPSVQGILTALQQNAALRAVVVGLTHNETSQRYRQIIESHPACERVICLGWSDQVRLNELYNACDIALFGNASISCQAALGTGMVGCLAANGTMDFLVTMPGQAFFFRVKDIQDIAGKLGQAAEMLGNLPLPQRESFRGGLAEGSRWLGYDRILKRILQEFQRRISSGTGTTDRQGHSAD